MKIVFFGSDDFAVVNLEKLYSSQHKVAAVVTQPDRARGRGMKIGVSSVKEFAGKHDLSILQPIDLKDEFFLQQLKGYESDLFVVIAYGKFLPSSVLAVPQICSINVHGSLLPKYRGAAPINWALINGDKKTGVSIIQMNEGMDTGDIITQEKIYIDDNDTSLTLRKKMADLGAQLLIKTIDSLEKKQFPLTPQDEADVTYAPKLKKEMGLISWDKSAGDIHNLVRGLLPWPCAFTAFDGKLLKILEADVCTSPAKECSPGEICEISKEGLCVATAKGALLVKKVHPESSKAMDAASFAAGHKVEVSDKFS